MRLPARAALFGAYKRLGDRHRSMFARIPCGLRVYQGAYRVIKPRGALTVDAQGMRLSVIADDDVMMPQLLAYGVHEPTETALVEREVTSGMTVFDLGANIGYFSVLAARRTGTSGRVFAFEPEPRNYELLCENIHLNQATNVKPIRAAVTDSAGTMMLYRDKHNFGAHTLSADNIQTSAAGRVEVPTTTLDEFMVRERIERLDFLKMDVQGAEGHVLRGGSRTFREQPVKLLLEFWPEGFRRMGTQALEFLTTLRDWGFQHSIVDDRGVHLTRDLRAIVDQAVRDKYVNLYCQKLG